MVLVETKLPSKQAWLAVWRHKGNTCFHLSSSCLKGWSLCEISDHERARFSETLTITKAFDPGVEQYKKII